MSSQLTRVYHLGFESFIDNEWLILFSFENSWLRFLHWKLLQYRPSHLQCLPPAQNLYQWLQAFRSLHPPFHQSFLKMFLASTRRRWRLRIPKSFGSSKCLPLGFRYWPSSRKCEQKVTIRRCSTAAELTSPRPHQHRDQPIRAPTTTKNQIATTINTNNN